MILRVNRDTLSCLRVSRGNMDCSDSFGGKRDFFPYIFEGLDPMQYMGSSKKSNSAFSCKRWAECCSTREVVYSRPMKLYAKLLVSERVRPMARGGPRAYQCMLF